MEVFGKLSEAQAGFRQSYSTTDHLFTFKSSSTFTWDKAEDCFVLSSIIEKLLILFTELAFGKR
jgi:hypothetical protein